MDRPWRAGYLVVWARGAAKLCPAGFAERAFATVGQEVRNNGIAFFRRRAFTRRDDCAHAQAFWRDPSIDTTRKRRLGLHHRVRIIIINIPPSVGFIDNALECASQPLERRRP